MNAPTPRKTTNRFMAESSGNGASKAVQNVVIMVAMEGTCVCMLACVCTRGEGRLRCRTYPMDRSTAALRICMSTYGANRTG